MKPNDIIDHHLYEVRLIVAIPDYGTPTAYSALDAIVPHLDSEVILLGMHQHELTLANVLQTTTVVEPKTTTSTNVVVASSKTRTKAKATRGHQRWTNAERKEMKQLANKGIAHKEIAKLLGRSTSAVDNQLWIMNKGA